MFCDEFSFVIKLLLMFGEINDTRRKILGRWREIYTSGRDVNESF